MLIWGLSLASLGACCWALGRRPALRIAGCLLRDRARRFASDFVSNFKVHLCEVLPVTCFAQAGLLHLICLVDGLVGFGLLVGWLVW